MIALTFEAGGDPAPAGPILAALRRAEARVTFFLDGRWAETHAGLVQQMAADGHELANHGYRHPDWTELPDAEILVDLAETERVVRMLTGRSSRPWARPPFGAVDDRVLRVLEKAGYHAVYRDAVDGGHWPGETTVDSIRERALTGAMEGSVIVFHTDRPDTATALPEVLDRLAEAGLRPGTLTDLDAVPSPRAPLHPDFDRLEARPGYIRPRAPGRWRSLNLLELGAAQSAEPNRPRTVAETAGAAVRLLTGDPAEPLEGPPGAEDRHLLVLAGELRCELSAERGRHLGHVLARPGDLVLWPRGAAVRLTCDRRWTGLLIGPDRPGA